MTVSQIGAGGVFKLNNKTYIVLHRTVETHTPTRVRVQDAIGNNLDFIQNQSDPSVSYLGRGKLASSSNGIILTSNNNQIILS